MITGSDLQISQMKRVGTSVVRISLVEGKLRDGKKICQLHLVLIRCSFLIKISGANVVT